MSGRTEPALVVVTAAAPRVGAGAREAFGRDLAANRPRGAVVVDTCHRVELYAAAAGAVPPAGAQTLTGDAAARHLVRLAVGLESTVVGEDQILHQLRTAFADARATGELPDTIDRAFQFALRTGRQARAWREMTPRSMADVAVDAIAEHAGTRLAARAVLVVGAGRMGRLATLAARRAGATVTVASRDLVRARHLARAVGGDATTFDDPLLAREGLAGVIVALAGPWHAHPDVIDRLAGGDMLVVDLSQPPAVPAELAVALGGRLETVDTLAQRPRDPADARLTARLEQAAKAATAEFLAWHDRRAAATAARILTAQAERERTDALQQLWRDLPNLAQDERERIDRMSRHLAARLLREPLERLGHDDDGTNERAARRLFGL